MLVFEDLSKVPRRRLCTLFGVEWYTTTYAWLSLPIFLGIGFMIALLKEKGSSWDVAGTGAGYGLLLYLSQLLHTLGHILSSRLAHVPMDGNLLTATFHVNLYSGDQATLPRAVHLQRSLGGPLTNLLIGLVALGLYNLTKDSYTAFFAFANLASGLYTLLPIPKLDGWVIWGGLLHTHRIKS